MWRYNYTDELYHHGVKGQRWGIRRYQYKDGSLTPAGRRRVNKLKEEYTELTGKRLIRKPTSKAKGSQDQNQNKNKTYKEMTDIELRTKTDRLNAEKNYLEAVKNHKAITAENTSKGKGIVNTFIKEMIVPSAVDVGKQLVKSYMTKAANEGLKLENEYKVYTNNKKKN